MNVLQIDSCCNIYSTGRIAEGIGKEIIKSGGKSFIAYGRYANESTSIRIKIGNNFSLIFHLLLTRIFDKHGFGSKLSTINIIKKLDLIKPDLVHLHDIHGYYINVELLFNYLKKTNIPVVWTQHSLWAITGHCAYFDRVNCFKWKKLCSNCPQKKSYPASFLFDRSTLNHLIKRNLFTSIKNMKIVAVSNWIKKYLEESYLNKYEIITIYNGIDTNIFNIRENQIRKEYDLEKNYLILGVASHWEERKGLRDFIMLSKYIENDCKIILIGLDRKHIKRLPKNIIGVGKIKDPYKLAEFYSSSDVFFNPTWEDNFPTTNLEALSCGIPVVTYNTGGSPESVDKDTGYVVEKGDIKSVLEIIRVIKKKGRDFYRNKCRLRALKYFNQETNYKKYIELYNEMIINKK